MWYIILGFLALLYLFLNTIIPSQGVIGTYVLEPSLWLLLALLSFIIARNDDLKILKFSRLRRGIFGNSPIYAGLFIAGFQISLLMIVGIFTRFGTSPYSFTPFSIFRNIIFVSSLLLGTEISRAYLIKRGTRSKRYTAQVILLTTFLYVAIQLHPSQLTLLSAADITKILEFLGITIITSIAMNLLACYLSYIGGATASLSYVGTLLVFEWFSPVLPAPHWTILALIGTIAPAIGFLLIQDSIREPGHRKQRFHRKKTNEYSWTAVAIFSVVMVFFSLGYLGVKPTIIYSGSMKPTLDVGDIAIVQKIDTAKIKIGDIIQFFRNNVTVIHRVVQITENEGQTLFTTKGDANQNPDANPVNADYILGKSVFTIPKLGWIQIFIRDIVRKVNINI